MKTAGTAIWSDRFSDRRVERRTVQCVHCGRHWVPQPGSGRVRGWCQKCHGWVCGPKCNECVPMEQWLENFEQGRALNYVPIVVSVPVETGY